MLRHDQNRVGGLGHNVASLRDIPGHRAACNENRVLDGSTACKVDQFTVSHTERCFEGCRMLHFAADGDVFVGNRCVFFEGACYIERGLDVENGDPDTDRDFSGRNDASGRFVDGNDLITRRIDFRKKTDLGVRILRQQLVHGCDSFFIMRFYGDDDARRFHCFGNGFERIQNCFGMECKNLSVKFQERFAFRAVKDNGIRRLVELGIGRKSCASRTGNAGVFHNK